MSPDSSPIVTQGKPSIELARTARGEVTVTVKVYGSEGEEVALSTSARAVFDDLCRAYPRSDQ